MNIILFEAEEMGKAIPASDRRVQHIRKVLHIGKGDVFEAGLIHGKRGRAWIASEEGDTVVFEGTFDTDPDPMKPIELVLGFVRPLCAKRILKDMTAIGVRALHFVTTDTGEKSYRDADLWKGNAYAVHLIEGAEQGFSTLIPEVSLHWSLSAYEESLSSRTEASPVLRIAFDNGEDALPLSSLPSTLPSTDTVLIVAVGSERGWSEAERRFLADSGYRLVSLGRRILRTESACAVGIGILCARYGLL
jgi:RsmE family RNA methyltransferase